MNHKRKFYSLIMRIVIGLSILFFSINFSTYGQPQISGVINTVSARIDAVYSSVSTDVDSVHVGSVTGFTVGDTVLVHMTVGAYFYPTNHQLEGDMSGSNNSGKYAIFILQEIDPINNYLVLNSTLPNITTLVPGEFGQILKVPTYKSARIINTLTCNPYNPVTGTGGILVLLVKQGLIFDANINVDGKGFPGAVPDPAPYGGTCSTSDSIAYSKPFYSSAGANFAALKGYSVAYTTNDSTRGRGAIINGGGGGNGKYSGGGGGANGGAGGVGGYESDFCTTANELGGFGGKATSLFYLDDNRIGLGGGGGTSSQSLPLRKATAGGAGGGIVIIVCDTLKGNGIKYIHARGQSVTDSATAGGGGGGGGGTIILHVNKYITNPKFWVNGGNGGKIANTVPEACGPGGGGGSGVIWYNGLNLGSFGYGFDISAGKNGTYNGLSNGASSGSSKPPVNNLLIPIRGFLFNYIPDADTICKNDTPKPINAAPPVGGTGEFTYNWLQSSDSISWVNAEGTRDKVNYTPPPATNITMFYKRSVYNPPVLYDTSNVVKMYVLPVLVNNTINPDTTVCAELNAGTLYSLQKMAGGNGSYKYYWEKFSDNTFASPDTVGNSTGYETPMLFSDTYYRRKVVSSACKSTSDTIKITVIPVITNNIIDSAQEICTTRTPENLTGRAPAGGVGTYTYKWQKKTVDSWSDEVNTPTYQPPALTLSHQYRRIAYSGPASTCKDTSAVLVIDVMADITNNTVNPITQNILCSGLNGEILTAAVPVNGNGTYRYYWQKNDINATGGNVMTNFDPGILNANATFRRIVSSGNNPDSLQRCWSTSNVRAISILENITNNNLSVPKTIWCEGKIPDDITGSIPLNGNSIYAYSWQRKVPAGNWTDTIVSTIDFNTPLISSSVDYRRIVKSGLNGTCKDTSNIISFTMQNRILNNRINGDSTVFVCFDEDSVIQATTSGILTGGDETNYTYLWKQSPAVNGTFVDAPQTVNSDSFYHTEAIQTTRFYIRRVISGDCETSSQPVKIEPLSLPELIRLKADRNDICFSKNYPVLKASVQSGTSPYIVSFNDGQGFTDSKTFESGSDSIQPQITNPSLSPGFIDYNFKVVSVKDTKGCFAKADNLDPFSAPFRVYTTPEPSRISDTLVKSCSGTIQISVNPSFGLSSWYLRNISGVTAGSTTNPVIELTANYADNDEASVSLLYVENIANCYSDTIFVDAVLYNNPDPIKNIYSVVDNAEKVVGDTVVIFILDNQKFRADTVVSGIAEWRIASGSGVLKDHTLVSTSITNLVQDDPAYLQYSISNGICPVNTRTIKIERKELLVYDGFSPNDDGKNDELWSLGLADEEVDFKFQIFSSSGNFIREITRKDIKVTDLVNNQVVLWDGTTKLGGAGNFIPDGTYYYALIVKYHDQTFNKKGSIIVKR